MRTSGFSLLELLVVIGILGILLALGAPSLLGFLNSSRSNEAAAGVAASLRQAGGQALTRSESMTATVTGGGSELTWSNAGGTQVQTMPLPSHTKITALTPAGPIRFSGRGLPVEQYTLTLKTANVTRTVLLLVTGKVVTR